MSHGAYVFCHFCLSFAGTMTAIGLYKFLWSKR